MHRSTLAALSACACLLAAAGTPQRAAAEIVVSVNKATQTMSVLVDGLEKYTWAVSTGLGNGPPSGSYKPQRFERRWWSHKYNRAPMPHSIFFYEGYAIHGTIHIKQLGRRASKGCVRLHPDNAAILFDLVRGKGSGQTRIVIANATHVMATPPAPKIEAPPIEAPQVAAPKVEPVRVEANAEPPALAREADVSVTAAPVEASPVTTQSIPAPADAAEKPQTQE